MAKSVLREKSYAFAIRIVKMCQYLQKDKKELVLSKQLIRSGTAIGALLKEAEFGQSKSDFISKMHIALKEANETEYWLNLLSDTGYLENPGYESIIWDCKEIIAMLVSSIKTSKKIYNLP